MSTYLWQWQASDGRWHDLNPEFDSESDARSEVSVASVMRRVTEPLRLVERTVIDKVLTPGGTT